MMKSKIVLIIVLTIILSGFVFAFILNISPITAGGCTQIGCSCLLNPNKAEIPCNTCTKTKYYYYTLAVNVEKCCQAREIIVCKDGELIDSRIGEFNECVMNVVFFGRKIN